MVLTDVNILVYAHREDVIRHCEYLDWVDRMLNFTRPLAFLTCEPSVFSPDPAGMFTSGGAFRSILFGRNRSQL